MIKVGFNVSPLEKGHQSRGVGTYILGLLKALEGNSEVEISTFKDLDDISTVDLIHQPFFSLVRKDLNFKKGTPTVVTVHDLIPLIFKKHYPFGIKATLNLFFQKRAIRKADAIITVSESAKADIIKYLKIAKEKVFVVYQAPKDVFRKVSNAKEINQFKDKYGLKNKFALYVGDINWNKNLLNLAEACMQTELDLVLVGKGFEYDGSLDHPEMASYKKFVDKYSKNERVKKLGFISDGELNLAYSSAEVLLFPSFYEGFGYPILEAQSANLPVITSNVSSMPEVAGKGALLVNPDKMDEIKEAIITVVTDKELRNKLIDEGRINIKRFNWDKTAEDTISVYKSVLKK